MQFLPQKAEGAQGRRWGKDEVLIDLALKFCFAKWFVQLLLCMLIGCLCGSLFGSSV